METLVVLAVVIGIVSLVTGMPGSVIAQRRGLRNTGIAFLPGLGLFIVLFQSVERSGWLAMLMFVPFIGALVVQIWTAAEVPNYHGRSGWWTAAFLVPGVSLIAWWVYAYTLEQETVFAFA